MVIWMIPPQAQLQVEPAVNAGFPPTSVLTAPGFHGVVTGTHGMGVNTPSAAAVAVATVGLDRLVHMPKGGTFTSGTESMMLAAGRPSIMTRDVGSGASDDGANPKLHWINAPSTVFCGMGSP
jgi:hypothetical protein